MKTANQRLASFILNDLKGILAGRRVDVLRPQELGVLMRLEHDGLITRKQTRETVRELIK